MESLAATFGWLCVETYSSSNRLISSFWQPPSGGCVLKQISFSFTLIIKWCSHLRVAVC